MSDDQQNGSTADKGQLTPEQIALIQRKQRRNIAIALVLGALLAVLGFFAGRAIRANVSAPEMPASPAAIVLTVEGGQLGGQL